MKIYELLKESEFCDLEAWKYKYTSVIAPRRIMKFIKTKYGVVAVLDKRTDSSYVFGGSWKSPTNWSIK